MINSLAFKLADRLEKNNIIKSEDTDFCRYGIEVFIISFIKLSALIVLAAFTGLVIETIIFIIAFSSLRIQAGGAHAESVLICFLLTVVSIYITILVCKIIPIPTAFLLQESLLFWGMILIYLYSPKESPNKPLTETEKVVYRRRSIKTVIILSIIIIFINITNVSLYYFTSIASIAIFLEAVTLTPFVLNYNKNNAGGE